MKWVILFSARTPAELRLRPQVRRGALRTLNQIPKSLLRRRLKGLPGPYYLEIAFLSKPAIKKMNQTYRRKNRATDVLSFSGLETPTPLPKMAPTLIGQIVLCWPVIQLQAKSFKVPASEELQRMTIHGILHVFGYDHESDGYAAKKMFRLQEKILKA